MSVSKAKEELTKLIEEQPEDSSHEEIVRELAFHVMVQRGLADSEAGRVISNDEMARRIRLAPSPQSLPSKERNLNEEPRRSERGVKRTL